MVKKYIVLISAIVIAFLCVWFHRGLIIAIGESGIPFYNTSGILHLYNGTWASVALGIPTGATIASIPFYLFINIFFALHIPDFLIQAFIFGIILFSSSISMFLLPLGKLDKRKRVLVIAFASVFYLCNFVALVSIWYRMQYPFIFFYVLLPLAGYLFFIGLKKRNYFYSVYINFICASLTMVSVTFPLLELFWGILGFYILYNTLLYRKDKKFLIFAWSFYMLSIVIWFLFNLWWILPFIETILYTPYISSQGYNVGSDINSLVAESAFLGNLSYVFRMISRNFLFDMKDIWTNVYFSPIFILISYIIPFLAFFPLLLKRKKPSIIYFFLGLSLLLIFLMKGSNDPFGFIFYFLFSHSRFFETFRNPFEKFGLALPFAYAPLIGYSLVLLWDFWEKRLGNIRTKFLVMGVCISIFVILVFPLWNGWVFSSYFSPTNNLNIGDYVKVPDYYKRANNWLSKDSQIFRMIAFPLNSEGITQTWQYGYNGVDFLNGIFDRPVISLSTSMEFLPNITTQLSYLFFKYPQYFADMMSFLNAKYVIIRSDIDYQARNSSNPSVLTRLLSHGSIPDLSFVKRFGKLSFYINTKPNSKIYAVHTVYTGSDVTPFATIFGLTSAGAEDVVLNNLTPEQFERFRSYSKDNIIIPSSTMNISTLPTVKLSDAIGQIPYARFLPGSRLYPLIQFKESVNDYFLVDSNTIFFNKLDETDKRLGELRDLSLSDTSHLALSEQLYEKSLSDLQTYIMNGSERYITENQNYIQFRINAEKVLLDDLLNSRRDTSTQKIITKAKDALLQFARREDIFPLFSSQFGSSVQGQEIVYRLDVKQDGDYAISLQDETLATYYNHFDTTQKLQIDNTITTVMTQDTNGWIHFGSFFFKKGVHEIHIIAPLAKNLIKSEMYTQGNIVTDKTITEQAIPLKNFDPFSSYHISLDYWVEKGGPISLQMRSDIDTHDDQGHDIPEWEKTLAQDNYENYWKNASIPLVPYPLSSTSTFMFIIKPFNDCLILYPSRFLIPSQCILDKNFYTSFSRPTSFWYKNLQLHRDFTNMLVLQNTNILYQQQRVPSVSFSQIDTAHYRVHITGATDPFFLVFSESFHPLWKLTFMDTGKRVAEENHLLGNSFANVWYINRKGDYTLSLDFTIDKQYDLGKAITYISMGISIVFIGIYMFIKRKKHE